MQGITMLNPVPVNGRLEEKSFLCALCESRGTAPSRLNLDARWMKAVDFTYGQFFLLDRQP